MFPEFSIEKSGGKPAYRQIIEKIESLVQSGKLGGGDKIPPERQLAERLGVARGTVKKAYEELARQHVIEASRGRGSFVAAGRGRESDRRKDRAVSTIERMIADLTALRFSLREIKSLVDLKILEQQEKHDHFHVALVDCNPEALAIYERQVAALSRVRTSRFLLDELRGTPDPSDVLRPFDVIVTTASHYPELAGMLHDRSDRVIQVVVAPRQESIIALARLTSSHRIGIICRSERFRQIIVDKLHELHIPTRGITHLAMDDVRGLARFLADRSVVVVPPGYSLVRRRDNVSPVQAFRGRGGKVIEFDYQIERGSLLQIEQRIRALLGH